MTVGYIEFVDGTRLYAVPRERPCICKGKMLCAFHAAQDPELMLKRKVAEQIYRACHSEWRGFIPRSIQLKYERMAEAAIKTVRDMA